MGKRRIQFNHTYDDIISIENLLEAWKEFICGKRSRKDVQEFERNLMNNLLSLHDDLSDRSYTHSEYEAFRIADPKPRNIHKAKVRDRLLHHAIHRKLYPFFDKRFIADSFSCRNRKGTHRALNRFHDFSYRISQNHTKQAYVLKCDIRKFFASIDQRILLNIFAKYITNKDILNLISKIVMSFHSTEKGLGLPLGNLTSQLFVNIYMNEFDQFMKHKVKAKYYIRYADDFVIFSNDRKRLEEVISLMTDFLSKKLSLRLHPDKVSINTVYSGIDYLGWIHFSDHLIVRTKTKQRMLRNIELKEGRVETVQSYLGLIGHGNSQKLKKHIETLVQSVSNSSVY